MAKRSSTSSLPSSKQHTSRISAADRGRDFKDDFYCEEGMLFCRFCHHSVDHVRKDTIKDHTSSKKHMKLR